jgi:hypothetical protein
VETFHIWSRNDNLILSEELIMELQTVPEITQTLEISKKVDTKKEHLCYGKFWESILI